MKPLFSSSRGLRICHEQRYETVTAFDSDDSLAQEVLAVRAKFECLTQLLISDTGCN
ncbi:MAG: hypothetical protein AB8G99_08990 [Planctomycetaceae bacterium]